MPPLLVNKIQSTLGSRQIVHIASSLQLLKRIETLRKKADQSEALFKKNLPFRYKCQVSSNLVNKFSF